MGRPAGAVRNGSFKLVEKYESGKLELYNLDEDIGENNDLSDKHPDKVKARTTGGSERMAESGQCQYAAAESVVQKVDWMLD